MDTEPQDQSVNNLLNHSSRAQTLLKRYGAGLVLVFSFMFFFYGGMAITNSRAFLSALCAAVLTATLVSPLLSRK